MKTEMQAIRDFMELPAWQQDTLLAHYSMDQIVEMGMASGKDK